MIVRPSTPIFEGSCSSLEVGVAPSGSAALVDFDTATQGNWTGTYGTNGEFIANVVNNPPAFATFSLTGDTPYTWLASTSDVRALETATGASASHQFDVLCSLHLLDESQADGRQHPQDLALSAHWDSTARFETVTLLDPTSGAILSQQTFSSFHSAAYAALVLRPAMPSSAASCSIEKGRFGPTPSKLH